MKKYLIIFVIYTGLFSCSRPIINFELPIEQLSGYNLMLLNYPLNSDCFVLCAGNYYKNRVDFALRDCFTNELISCVDSLGNLKDYIVLYLGEGFDDLSDSIYQPDGNEYYVKIYIAEHKKIDYGKQIRDWVDNGRLDTIEVDIDDRRGIIHSLTVENNEQWIPITATEKLLSYRLLELHFIQ